MPPDPLDVSLSDSSRLNRFPDSLRAACVPSSVPLSPSSDANEGLPTLSQLCPSPSHPRHRKLPPTENESTSLPCHNTLPQQLEAKHLRTLMVPNANKQTGQAWSTRGGLTSSSKSSTKSLRGLVPPSMKLSLPSSEQAALPLAARECASSAVPTPIPAMNSPIPSMPVFSSSTTSPPSSRVYTVNLRLLASTDCIHLDRC